MRTGIYVEPDAVASSPDYARALVEEAGVNVFQLRAGFDPSRELPGMAPAIEVIRELGAQVWFLVGTWWGHGVEPGEDRMEAVAATERRDLAPAHEAQWSMRTPGGPADHEIDAAIRGFCERYAPDGICLTHARYRHPADLPGLFEWGPGLFAEGARVRGLSPEVLGGAWSAAMAALGKMDAQELVDLTEACSVVDLLDTLAGGDVMERWFSYRCHVVERSVRRFQETARASGGENLTFGINAYRPSESFVTGQDYQSLLSCCDFIQPLLGYVRWHSLHPVGAWARLLLDRGKGIDEVVAIGCAAELYALAPEWMPWTMEDFANTDEGNPDAVYELVEGEFQVAKSFQRPGTGIMPVLRGRDWPTDVIEELSDDVESAGFDGLFYQGTDYLAGPSPEEGWG